MADEGLRKKTTRAVFWMGFSRYSNQILGFALQIYIARILVPSDYGIIGMISVFFALASIFVDSGFSTALIRKKDRTEIDNSTVFYYNMAVAILFYLFLFVASPLIAQFYNEPLLVPITRILGLTILFNASTSVQYSLYYSKLDFRPISIISLIATIISGVIGIFLAKRGYGVWVLVWQSVVRAIVNQILMWIFSPWRPLWVFSKASFKELFGFGSKIFAACIIDAVYNNLYNIFIGKLFRKEDLGLYTKAKAYSELPASGTTEIIQGAIYPLMCTTDNDERLLYVYKKFLKLFIYILSPIMFGMAAVAKPMISVMITDKWLAVVPLLQILCLSKIWLPIQGTNLDLLKIKGRSDLFLKLEIIKKSLGVVILLISCRFNVLGMCIGILVFSNLCLYINTYYSEEIIGFGFWKQMKAYTPYLLFSFSMAVIVHFSMIPFDTNIVKLVVGISVGVTYYVGISYLFKITEFLDLIQILKKKQLK